jgi:hypothetical protein
VAKLRMALAAMGQRETNVKELCQELGITGRRFIVMWRWMDHCELTGGSC